MGFNKTNYMKFLTFIGDAFGKLDVKTKLLLIAGVIIAILAIDKISLSNKLAKQEAVTKKIEANLKAANDSIRVVTNNAGKPEYDKLSFIVDNFNELKQQNAELAQEVKDIKGKVLQIQKQGYEIVHDTITINTEGQVIDSVVHLKSSYDTVYSKGNYRSLAFENTYNLKDSLATGRITKDKIGFTAVTGLKQTNSGYEIFVEPQYPGMDIISLEGAIIDKNFFIQPKSRPHLITIGLQVGWTPFTYDLLSKKGSVNLTQIGFGMGLNFNLNRILGK
jgi:hypothetical protein